jgi:hypothetical protein
VKRTLPFVTLLVLGACAEQPTQVELARPQAAVTESTNTNRPFEAEFINPCNGDAITFSGSIHERYSVQFANDGGMRISVHSNPQGISGTGASGITYNATGATNSSLKINPGAAQTDTFINNFNVVANGNAPTFKVREHMHVTVNANGEVTSEVVKFDVSCK